MRTMGRGGTGGKREGGREKTVSPAGQCRHPYGEVSSYGLLTKDYSWGKELKKNRRRKTAELAVLEENVLCRLFYQ